MGSHEHGFKIEDIIAELNQDVNAGKYKGLQEACEKASGKYILFIKKIFYKFECSFIKKHQIVRISRYWPKIMDL